MCVGSRSVHHDERPGLKTHKFLLSRNSYHCISWALRVNGHKCTAVWREMERNRSAAQWDCCVRERACFHCGGMCLLSWKYSSDFEGVFHTSSLWKGYCVSAAFCSACLGSSLLGPSGVQILRISARVVATHAFNLCDQHTFHLHIFFILLYTDCALWLNELFIPS